MGGIIKFLMPVPVPGRDDERNIYLYLPDSYECHPEKRYPVMYMFDGHNVFFDADATYGRSWGMKEYMDRSQKELIIVAVECDHQGWQRLSEYSPFDFTFKPVGSIQGRGEAFLNWMIHTLKPFIDSHYRTLPGREHTLIAGSSMGGLMALYAVTAHNCVFSGAACLSPSLWTNPSAVKASIQHSQPLVNTTVYMDYGSVELTENRREMADILLDTAEILVERQVYLTFRIVPGGTHCEASWEKQIPIFMDCLGI